MKKKNGFLILALTSIGILFVFITGFHNPAECGDYRYQNPTVTDIDGNIYHTVTIGKQVWMVENLKVTRYNDGETIPNIVDNDEWSKLTIGAYCNNNNNESYWSTYGRLYNRYAVVSGKLCPKGWHVPTDDDWQILFDYLTENGYGYSGSGSDIAKSMASNVGWTLKGEPGSAGNDIESNNGSGFSGLPGGCRWGDGTFTTVGYFGRWWIFTSDSNTDEKLQGLIYNSGYVGKITGGKGGGGYSVRCVKD